MARQRSLLVLVFAPLVLAASASAAAWGYKGDHGPEHWKGVCNTGQRQSPVDLVQSDAKEATSERLAFFNYNSAAPVRLSNNGHSVSAEVLENCPRAVGAGGLPGVYYLNSFHFHWQSEHKLDGQWLPLELHLVHVEQKHKSIDQARRDPQGLAVVGIFFEMSQKDNPALAPLVQAVKKVSAYGGRAADTSPLSLAALLPNNTDVFFRYDGSLTTPSCDEIVVWTVLRSTVPISSSQLQAFHEVRDSTNVTLSTNFRPVQPLNDRTLYLHTSGTSNALTPSIFGLLFVALSVHL